MERFLPWGVGESSSSGLGGLRGLGLGLSVGVPLWVLFYGECKGASKGFRVWAREGQGQL